MKRTAALLTCLLLCVTVANADVALCVPGAALSNERFEIWQEPLPAPDYLASHAACVARAKKTELPNPPPSPWFDEQRRMFSDALKKQRVDILVAPFQNQGYGLERTERALMSADLAYHIGSAARVADPFLTARALGEGARSYDRGEIVELARAVGATRAVVGYVGHDREHRMTVTIQVLEVGAGASVNVVQKDWRSVRFTHADPPFVVFHRMLPSVLESLSLPATKPHPREPVVFPTDASFSLTDLATDKSPVGPSLALSLLGAMTGSMDDRSRERLFERALVSSWHFDAPGVETTFLRAYALLGLEHRPSALALINGATGPDAVALRSLLNGDLPGAAAAVAAVENPLKRLLLAVQVDDLRHDYGKSDLEQATDAQSVFGDEALDWLLLAQSRAEAENFWHVDEAPMLKFLLDRASPIAGLDVESVLSGGLVVGAPIDDVAVDLASIRHVARFVEGVKAPVCCAAASVRPTSWDLVGLIEGRIESRIGRYLYLTIVTRSDPETGADAIERYRSVFEGYPQFAVARAHYALEMQSRSDGTGLQRWRDEARQQAEMAVAGAAGQSSVAMEALRLLEMQHPEAGRHSDAYGFDYPRRPYWPLTLSSRWGITQQDNSAIINKWFDDAVPYARTDIDLFRSVWSLPESEKAIWLAALEPRFVGNPGHAALLTSLRPPRPKTGDVVADARAVVADDPENWQTRFSAGRGLINEHGKWKEAAELMLEHPHLRLESPPNRVALSNSVYEAGSLFYWAGHEDLAIPFYEVAARLDTGASSEITSEARLDILEGRYQQATARSFERAQRYPSEYAFRDFLSFLHALGYGEEAWSGFSQVSTSFDNPQIWVSALVGQRMKGLTEPEMRAWLKQPGIRDARFRANLFAPRHAILVNATDREPPEDLGALVAELEGEPAGHVINRNSHERPDPGSSTGTIEIYRSAFVENEPPLPVGTPVKSEYAFFGTAYAAIHHGRFDEAVAELKAMAMHYMIEISDYSFALPYFAWAAAETGDTIGLERFVVEHYGPNALDFDARLARAFFHGARNETELALEDLDKALRWHPYTEYRPVLIEYQYAEACEWLYKKTGDEAFIDTLLAWAISQQRVQPTHAWSYAMEYTYARTPERKLRGLAMTLYLDPESPRIRGVSAKERADAKAWGDAHNPFLQEQAPTDDGRTAGVQAPTNHG